MTKREERRTQISQCYMDCIAFPQQLLDEPGTYISRTSCDTDFCAALGHVARRLFLCSFCCWEGRGLAYMGRHWTRTLSCIKVHLSPGNLRGCLAKRCSFVLDQHVFLFISILFPKEIKVRVITHHLYVQQSAKW